jgi:hypothetical protein
MRIPATPDEFVALVDEAIFEIDELLACAEDEGEEPEFGGRVAEYREIADALRRLKSSIAAGTYEYATGNDLEFMAVARAHKGAIPCYGVLEALNLAHKRGF